MVQLIIAIGSFIIIFGCIIYSSYKTKQLIKENKSIIDALIHTRDSLIQEKIELENQKNSLSQACDSYSKLLDKVKGNYDSYLEEMNELYEEKAKQLELQQQEKNDKIIKEYKEKENQIAEDYEKYKKQKQQEKEEVEGEILKIRNTYRSLIQAQLREKEITEKQDFYCLKLNDVDLEDVQFLKSIQHKLSNSDIINKIIWSNYYQPLAKNKFPQILKSSKVCGIYKLTNRITGESYIGQSLDVSTRWAEHCKNALGVGSNKGTNKLYSNIKEYGLNNFSFELLEECRANELNEKEKYYIELYDTYNFGLNSNTGINKK